MSEYNLETVIEDALTDAQLPTEAAETDLTPEVEVEAQTSEESAPEANVEAAEAAVKEAAAMPETTEAEKKAKSKVFEDFDKKFGVEATYPNSGRENRIPYSRVKKIAQKAVRDARKEWEEEHNPKFTEYEGKVKDYETRLAKVGQFEKVMTSQPEQFLQMLASLPAYKEFFEAVEKAFATPQTEPQAPAQAKPQAKVNFDPDGPQPQPDVPLSDGTRVYSEEGLAALNAWNRAQAKKETLEEVNKRFGPIEQEWQAQQRINSLKPVVNQQIAEARTWELFNENEQEIVKVLKDNPRISLEGAYRQVVFPKLKANLTADRDKLVADRQKMREELLAELKGAPKSTTVSTQATKGTQVTGEPRSLEDIIAEQIKTLR